MPKESHKLLPVFPLPQDPVASPVTLSTFLDQKTIAFIQLGGKLPWMGGQTSYSMPSNLEMCIHSFLKVLGDVVPSPQ